jgi:hypothetical protein
MKPCRERLMAIAVFVLSASQVWAGAGTEGTSFLEIPVGAGPAAMGSAYTALATDAYAPTWNPGGLGWAGSPQMTAEYLSYVESIHYGYTSFAYPLRPGTGIGASVQYLGTGSMEATEVGGASLGTFSSHFAAYSLAYGQTLTDRLSLGVTGKFIEAKISDVGATGYAVDLGGLYRIVSQITLAATVNNLGRGLDFLGERDALPLAFHFAAAYAPTARWSGVAEGVFAKMDQTSFRVGGQWRPVEPFSLRAGYRTDTLKELSALAGLSTGFGVHFWDQEFAYAWVPMSDLGQTHYVSLVIRFKAAPPAAEERSDESGTQPVPAPRVLKRSPPRRPPSLEYGAPEAPSNRR